MNKGRPLDQIWTQFEKTNTGKAKCKDCGCEFAALVERMKTHYSKFHAKTAQDDATAPKQLLDWFVTGWQKLRKIVEEHPEYFNGPGKSIAKTIKDLCIFQQIEDAKKCLQPVAEALDTIQGNNVCTADGVDIWKTLLENTGRRSKGNGWLAPKRGMKDRCPMFGSPLMCFIQSMEARSEPSPSSKGL